MQLDAPDPELVGTAIDLDAVQPMEPASLAGAERIVRPMDHAARFAEPTDAERASLGLPRPEPVIP